MVNIYFGLISEHHIGYMGEYVNFVKKEYNPANLPEMNLRFLVYSKRKVYVYSCQTKNLSQIRNRIKYCFGKLACNIVYGLRRSTQDRLNNIRMNDVIEKH